MSAIFPFAALRPEPGTASRVASVPYDVVNTEEARALAAGNPLSFLHVSRPEIDLPPGTDLYADEVYAESRKHGVHWVVPIRGATLYGKPIANFPRTKNKVHKVFLTEVGTDNAKELLYSRMGLPIDTAASQAGTSQPGVVHLPANDALCDESEVKQLTSEKKKAAISKGKRVMRWDSGGRRNEALDCFVYALAALRICQQRFGLDLDVLVAAVTGGNEPDAEERPRKKSSHWNKN